MIDLKALALLQQLAADGRLRALIAKLVLAGLQLQCRSSAQLELGAVQLVALLEHLGREHQGTHEKLARWAAGELRTKTPESGERP